ncbi:hypothetical protein PGIGA_G00116010 [Pangasianodon gigas]|uniref:Uncharacterized protein n=1 Tax=Pangasianodon gigas TaxID=30993 RepID=A0ACC5XES2_PANGG|nr:hypothetical protein [Pangasianodon gigas]
MNLELLESFGQNYPEVRRGECVPLCVEVHPLLGVKGDGKSKKKAAGRPKGSKGKEKDSTFRPKLFDRERDRGAELDGAGLKGTLVASAYKPHDVQGLD